VTLADGLVEEAGPVLVTGAGGPAGVSVVQALRRGGERVLAVDCDPGAVGFHLADAWAVVPAADEPEFGDALAAVAQTHEVAALVPTVAEELAALVAAEPALRDLGVATWLPPLGAVETCLDKWRFAEVLAGAGVPAPATARRVGGGWQVAGQGEVNGPAEAVPGPWVVKPRAGRGSRDVLVARDEEQLRAALALVPDPIVQQRAPGREFTADLLVGPDGELCGWAARWRLETRGGISTRGETFEDAAVVEVARAALGAVDHRGPANLQGFADPATGQVLVTEINPRFSGGLPLSLAAGCDLVGEYLRAVRGQPIRPERLRARPGVRMTRYFAEVFEGLAGPLASARGAATRPVEDPS
jgi:carbamoyl-phosphate synthase large subunit